jgi:hypothetical protein
MQMRLSCVAEDLQIMIPYLVFLALQFLPKTEYLHIQDQNEQQLFEALGAIITSKQRNISTD